MELIWKDLEAERLFERRTVQVKVEGELPSPDGRSIAQIISSGGRVYLTSAAAEADEIRLEGRIDVLITAADGDGAAFGFESGANFRHTISLPGALRGMSVEAHPCIQSLTALPKGVFASLEACVDVDLRVTDAAPMRVIGGVDGVKDLELKTLSMAHSQRREIGGETLRLREELSAEGISDVLSCRGLVSIRDVTVESGAAAVSGQVSVSAITLGRDGRMGQLVRSVPFRERIAVNSPAAEAFCTAELKSLYLRSLGEDFGIAAMEAEISFSVSKLETASLAVPVDAFSPTIGFGCLNEHLTVSEHLGLRTLRLTLQEELPLPGGRRESERPIFASASAVITEAVPEGDRLAVSGVFVTEAAYEGPSGKPVTFTADIPFGAAIETPAGTNASMLAAACVCEPKGAGENGLQAEYTLELTAECFRESDIEALAGLAEGETPERTHGLAVCFASEGEDAFDIAKRFSVPCSTVRQLNPLTEEPYKEGDKLILLT